MPAPDFDLVTRVALAGRLLPEKATSFQPKPSIGVLIRSLRDEMIRPELTSTSTLEAGPPAVEKNRRRTAPATSTTSSADQVATDDRTRPPHTAQSSVSTL